MANEKLKNAASAYLGSKALKKVKLSWLGYAAAAYVGLRFMKKRGIMPKQADKGLKLMEKGSDKVMGRFGFRRKKAS